MDVGSVRRVPRGGQTKVLVRDHDSSNTLWSKQVGGLARTVTGWTGNDARVVEYTIEELRAASAEPTVGEVVEHGITVAGTPCMADQAAASEAR